MAKKKKVGATDKRQSTESRGTTAAGVSTGYLWMSFFGGLLAIVLFFVLPWVSVLAVGKTSLNLVMDAVSKGSVFTGVAVLFTLVSAGLAIALPFFSPNHDLRSLGATLTALSAGMNVLLLTILGRSTRNLLAMDAGRQVVTSEFSLMFIAMAIIGLPALGYLFQRDVSESEDGMRGAYWFGAFTLVLLIILFFNYNVIPTSLIPPPEYIRQRLEWMN